MTPTARSRSLTPRSRRAVASQARTGEAALRAKSTKVWVARRNRGTPALPSIEVQRRVLAPRPARDDSIGLADLGQTVDGGEHHHRVMRIGGPRLLEIHRDRSEGLGQLREADHDNSVLQTAMGCDRHGATAAHPTQKSRKVALRLTDGMLIKLDCQRLAEQAAECVRLRSLAFLCK